MKSQIPIHKITNQNLPLLGSSQTCTRPEVFANLPLWTSFFSPASLFLEGSAQNLHSEDFGIALNFSSQKNRQRKAGQITNIVLQRLQVLCRFGVAVPARQNCIPRMEPTISSAVLQAIFMKMMMMACINFLVGDG